MFDIKLLRFRFGCLCGYEHSDIEIGIFDILDNGWPKCEKCIEKGLKGCMDIYPTYKIADQVEQLGA